MNCKNCDRKDCKRDAAHLALHTYNGVVGSVLWQDLYTATCDALRDCESNSVDWRARCLAAEAKAAYWPHAAMVAHTLRGRIMALDVAMQSIRGANLDKRQQQALELAEHAITELQAEADRVAAMIGEP